jgi:hypothetical protein
VELCATSTPVRHADAKLYVTDLRLLLPPSIRAVVEAWDREDSDPDANVSELGLEIDEFLLRGAGGEEDDVFPPEVGLMLEQAAIRESKLRREWSLLFEWAYNHVQNKSPWTITPDPT